MANAEGTRECNRGGGGIRDEELRPGEALAGVNARDARDPEPEEEVDERETLERVAPAVKGALEESRRDLAVVGDIGGKGYSYGFKGSVL